MLRTYAGEMQLVRHLLEAALEALATLHEVLDVVNRRKIYLETLEKLVLILRNDLLGQQLQQVAEIVTRVEAKPVDTFTKHSS